jgi:hypothetical protein
VGFLIIPFWYEAKRQLERTWTLSASDAGILTNFVAVVLALAAPRIFLVVQRVFELQWTKSKAKLSPGNDARQAGVNGQDDEQITAPDSAETLQECTSKNPAVHSDQVESSRGDTTGAGNDIVGDITQAKCKNISTSKIFTKLIKAKCIPAEPL